MNPSFVIFLLDIGQGHELDFIGASLNRYCASDYFNRHFRPVASDPINPEVECDAAYRERLRKMVEVLK